MVFEPALDELARRGRSLYGPTSFRDYVEKHDLDVSARTPRYISVDSLGKLASELDEANVMVLRLGSATGTGTQFLLVEAEERVEEFFLLDEAAFGGREPIDFHSPVEREQLLSFHLLPTLSETSLVNLALASGVLGEALELDATGSLMPPATGRSTFTFDVRPHSAVDETFIHRTGQVEIDTMFAERRGGETTLFVIEAKTGRPESSLAKHKLVYPMLALADAVPAEIEIVPVYMRCAQEGDEITFWIAECAFPDPRERVAGIDELELGRSAVVRLELG